MAHHPELDAGVLFSDSLGEEQPPQEWRRAGSLHSHDVPQESRDIRGFFRPSGMSSSTVGAALPPTCAAPPLGWQRVAHSYRQKSRRSSWRHTRSSGPPKCDRGSDGVGNTGSVVPVAVGGAQGMRHLDGQAASSCALGHIRRYTDDGSTLCTLSAMEECTRGQPRHDDAVRKLIRASKRRALTHAV